MHLEFESVRKKRLLHHAGLIASLLGRHFLHRIPQLIRDLSLDHITIGANPRRTSDQLPLRKAGNAIGIQDVGFDRLSTASPPLLAPSAASSSAFLIVATSYEGNGPIGWNIFTTSVLAVAAPVPCPRIGTPTRKQATAGNKSFLQLRTLFLVMTSSFLLHPRIRLADPIGPATCLMGPLPRRTSAPPENLLIRRRRLCVINH